MKKEDDEHDFSQGEREKFYRPDAEFELRTYPETDVETSLTELTGDKVAKNAPRTIPHSFGFRPDIDLNKLNQLFDELETEEFLKRDRERGGNESTLSTGCEDLPEG